MKENINLQLPSFDEVVQADEAERAAAEMQAAIDAQAEQDRIREAEEKRIKREQEEAERQRLTDEKAAEELRLKQQREGYLQTNMDVFFTTQKEAREKREKQKAKARAERQKKEEEAAKTREADRLKVEEEQILKDIQAKLETEHIYSPRVDFSIDDIDNMAPTPLATSGRKIRLKDYLKYPERQPKPETEQEMIVQEISKNLSEQNNSVQENWQSVLSLEAFSGVVEANGFKYLFLKRSDKFAVAFVQDTNNPKIWKPRAFRFSENENQWKSLPGIYEGFGPVRGAEENDFHHCVQSSKLVGEMGEVVHKIPKIGSEKEKEFENILRNILPKKSAKGEFIKYGNEFEFIEEFESFQDPEWSDYQSIAALFQRFFQSFNELDTVEELEKLNIQDKNGWFQEFLRNNLGNKNIKAIYDAILEYLRKYSALGGENLVTKQKRGRALSELFNFLKMQAQELTETVFIYVNMPKSMLPDFSVKPSKKYERLGVDNSIIKIEEYVANSPAGDRVVFCMATDSLGRVFIDNVYKNMEYTSYGGDRKIIHMGHLVYKMEDTPQNMNAVPEKYISDDAKVPGNKSMHKLWGQLDIVRKYKARAR